MFVCAITIAMFLCISHILYYELEDIESIVCSSFFLTAVWLILRTQMPIPWWTFENFSIEFWDLSFGLLALTATYRMVIEFILWLWSCSIQFRMALQEIAKEIWEDNLLSWTLIILLMLYMILMFEDCGIERCSCNGCF